MPPPTATIFVPYHALDELHQRGPRSAQPPASTVVPGTLYCVADEADALERSTGSVWEPYAPAGGGGGGGTGDVVGPASATDSALALFAGATGKLLKDSLKTIAQLTTDIVNAAIAAILPGGMLPVGNLPLHHTTHEPGSADALRLTAESRLFGRGAGALAGPVQEISLGSNLSMSGTVLNSSSAVAAHATTHQNGGTDPVAVTTLAGYPGGTTNFLRADGTFAAPAGGGNVTGPASAVDGNLASYNGTTGKIIKDSSVPAAQVARKDQANTFTQDQTFREVSGVVRLKLHDLSATVDKRKFELQHYAERVVIGALNDAENIGVSAFQVDRLGNTFSAGDVYEKNRSYPMGYWIDVPHNPANFIISSGAQWAINLVHGNSYCLIGTTLKWNLWVDGTTPADSPAVYIYIPYGTVSTGTMHPCTYIYSGGVEGPGVIFADYSNRIQIRKSSGTMLAGTVSVGFSISLQLV